MRGTRMISAGLLDSGFASLATFAVGLYAARALDAEVLGVYALFFSAFVMVSALTSKLFFVPAEAWVVSAYEQRREVLLRSTTRLIPFAFLISPVIVALSMLLVPEVDAAGVVTALAATTAACGAVSPLQDHVRRTLHIAERSWAAATVSGVQFLGAVGSIVALRVGGVEAAWIPFGALTAANVLSVTVAYALSGCWTVTESVALRIRDLVEEGRWLVSASLVSRGSDLAGSALIGALGGAAALGFAEAARVVAQPIVVLGTGLAAVLGPKAMDAGVRRDEATARQVGRRFITVMGVATVAYLLFTLLPAHLNPLAVLVPAAFEIPGLVALTVVAGAAAAASFVWGSELVAVGRSSWILPTDSVGAVARVGVAVTAGWIGAFAAPIGVGLGGIARLIGYGRSRHLHYDAPPSGPSTGRAEVRGVATQEMAR